MIIENSDALKSWLVYTLGTICDADPGALGKYVLALVRKDKEENELYAFCLDQLDVFLLKDTKYFVDLLFEALRTKSYLRFKPDSTHLINSKSTVLNSAAKDFISLKAKEDVEKEKNSKPNSEISNQKYKGAVGNAASIVLKETNSSKLINTRKYDDERSYDKQTEDSFDKSDKNTKKEDILCAKSSQSENQAKFDNWNDKDLGKKKLATTTYGDIDYKPEMPHGGYKTSYLPHNNMLGKISKRCQDYDEKGYCMRGDLCEFDHGSDPVVVEDVSILNFGVSIANVTSSDSIVTSLVSDPLIQNINSPLPPPPPTSPPPLPPPPPPLPPLPPSGAYVPEYNPEAPGMHIPLEEHSYWVPSNTGVHIPPPPLSHSSSGLLSSHIQIHHNTKPLRARELIGVPTIDVTSSNPAFMYADKVKTGFDFSRLGILSSKEKVIQKEESSPTIHSDVGTKRKGFDFSRLGPKPKRMNVESRSTLEVRKIPPHLNNIVSLISHFSKFGKVTNIQLFYEQDPEAALIQFQKHSEASAAYKSTEAVLNNRFIKVFWNNKTVCERDDAAKNEKAVDFNANEPTPGKKISDSTFLSIPDSCKTLINTNFSDQKTAPQRATTYSARGNLCRTVFNPALLKKTEVVPAKTQKEDLKNIKQRIELHKKKQDFLQTQLSYQKIIFDKLCKTSNESDKAYLKKLIKELAGKISILEADVRKSSEELLKLMKSHTAPSATKSEAEKELLDAELDLYTKQHQGDDTAELKAKVNELRAKAKYLGVIPLSTPFLDMGPIQNPKQVEVPQHAAAVLKLDNRPKTHIVADPQNKEALQKHFEALENGKQFEDHSLALSWQQDQEDQVASESAEEETIDDKSVTLNLLDEDEDEEEDSEARSWRR